MGPFMMTCCYISLSLSLYGYGASFYMYDMCSAAETIGKKFSFMRRFEVGERTEGNVTSSSPVVTAYGTTSVCVCVRGDPTGMTRLFPRTKRLMSHHRLSANQQLPQQGCLISLKTGGARSTKYRRRATFLPGLLSIRLYSCRVRLGSEILLLIIIILMRCPAVLLCIYSILAVCGHRHKPCFQNNPTMRLK